MNPLYLLVINVIFIECSNNGLQMKSPVGSSSALNSPCCDVPLVTSLKPPTILRRGPSGFGFTVNTIRVYFGDSDFYTMHHLVMVCNVCLTKKFIYICICYLLTYLTQIKTIEFKPLGKFSRHVSIYTFFKS